jgi:hypothetical protein
MKASKRVNSAFQTVHGNAVWVARSTAPDDLLALLRRLRPHDTSRGDTSRGDTSRGDTSRGLTRFGPTGDGGYLMPDDLDGIQACVSPGVSTESRFDLDIAQCGIDVFMADASVDGPSLSHPRFHFTKKFLGLAPDDTTLTLDAFIETIPTPARDQPLLLQMDIEGAEYGVLQSLSLERLAQFRILVIEFHDLDNLFSRFSFRTMAAVFDKLLHSHVVVGNITIPRVMEFTFYRRDRATFEPAPNRPYPHPLDADCVPTNPSLVLPACWR